MDWLDEILDKVKNRISNYSLKKALVVYILVCVAFVGTLTAVTQIICADWDNNIWSQYSKQTVDGSDQISVAYRDYTVLTKPDRILVEIIDFTQTWSTIIYSFTGIMLLSYMFYNRKLKEPLSILKEAAARIADNDLEVELYYDSKDEMGDLCRSFDLMRKQLTENNRKMWDMMEEQKRLNAAFAHDLRTPLTVLRGYIDLLSRYIPEDKISRDKLLDTLSLMSEHMKRLENYSNTMKEINSLEELPVKRLPVKAFDLENRLREITKILDGKNGIRIKLIASISEDKPDLPVDEEIVTEVFENIMSNALRYAQKEVEIILSLSEDGRNLILSVADDGRGFTRNDLVMAVRPYYTDEKESKSQHFGIGLYICKLLCEKHQGYITLENRMKQGAIVTAVFGLST